MANLDQDGMDDLPEYLDDDQPHGEPMGQTADRQRSLEDLKVQAQLRIGSATVPLKTILSIKVGEVIALDRPLSAPVQIIAGGRAVAAGELVAVNGFYAVRIKEVSVLERHLPSDPAAAVN